METRVRGGKRWGERKAKVGGERRGREKEKKDLGASWDHACHHKRDISLYSTAAAARNGKLSYLILVPPLCEGNRKCLPVLTGSYFLFLKVKRSTTNKINPFPTLHPHLRIHNKGDQPTT